MPLSLPCTSLPNYLSQSRFTFSSSFRTNKSHIIPFHPHPFNLTQPVIAILHILPPTPSAPYQSTLPAALPFPTLPSFLRPHNQLSHPHHHILPFQLHINTHHLPSSPHPTPFHQTNLSITARTTRPITSPSSSSIALTTVLQAHFTSVVARLTPVEVAVFSKAFHAVSCSVGEGRYVDVPGSGLKIRGIVG